MKYFYINNLKNYLFKIGINCIIYYLLLNSINAIAVKSEISKKEAAAAMAIFSLKKIEQIL